MMIFPMYHSPGPWRTGNQPWAVVDDRGQYVARVMDMRNRNLILSCHELLDFALTTASRMQELGEQLRRQGHPAADLVDGTAALGIQAAVRATFGERAEVDYSPPVAAKGGAA